MLIVSFLIFAAGLIPGAAGGFWFGYKHINEVIKKSFEQKLATLKAEIIAIEQTADRRIVVEIHKVTNRIKTLL